MTIKKRIRITIYIVCCILVISVIGSIPQDTKTQPEAFNPSISALVERRAYAILVGIEDYPDPWSDLYYCIDDVNSIYSKLYNQYGIDDTPIGIQYMQVLLDSEATKANIESAFSHVANFINPYDVFFFYFSGHGRSSLMPGFALLYSYDVNDPISSPDLDGYLDSVSCSEQYIIIDACGSGGMMDNAAAPNRYFMTACEREEECWETSALGHGVFTYYFLRSFTYASDSNGDGVISMEEQYDYTYPRTVSYSTGLGEAHHPMEYDGITGETVIDTTIASLVLTPNGTQLTYSFFIYGHGLITTLQITVCSVAGSITIETYDIIPEAPSNTGFGFYSGFVTISGSDNITSYKILVWFDWPKNPPGDPKGIQYTFGDSDGDNLTDLFEIDHGLNPLNNDTDSDGLDDYFEYYGVTDPLLNDTDGDGMLDGYEVFNDLDPLIDDSLLDLDEDGLINILEYTLGSSANNPDTDGDLMDDGYEYNCSLDLLNDDAQLDYDNDTLSNLLEYQLGSIANDSDTDDDTMPDGWEYDYGLNLTVDDANLDPDNDLLINIYEYTNNTHPNNNDTDNDGLLDGSEIIEHGTDPLLEDTDSDGMPDGWEVTHLLDPLIDDSALDPDVDDLTNIQEFQIGTDPQNPDTDGDTFTDGDEVLHGTDPLDPDDYPIPSEEQIPSYNPLLLLSVIVLSILFLTKRKLKISKN